MCCCNCCCCHCHRRCYSLDGYLKPKFDPIEETKRWEEMQKVLEDFMKANK